jgi:hypothetical protein
MHLCESYKTSAGMHALRYLRICVFDLWKHMVASENVSAQKNKEEWYYATL